MGEAKSIINEIKVIDNFSFGGCFYEKADDGSVSRSCDELRAEMLAECGNFEHEFEICVASQNDYVDGLESDKFDTRKKYGHVIGVQKSFIDFFRDNVEAVAGKGVDSFGSVEFETTSGELAHVSFVDLDKDGAHEGVSITYQSIVMDYPMSQVAAALSAAQSYGDAFAEDGFISWLKGEDFAPLISALLSIVQE